MAEPALDAVMTALDELDGLGRRPVPAVLDAQLRILAAGLVGADPLFRELVRAEAIARLDALGVRAPARIVDAALTGRPRDADPTAPGRRVLLADPDPWPEAVQGAALLDDIAYTYRRFVSLPDGGAEALALWVVFTYALDAFAVAPILTLSSPLKRCGKTTTEDVAAALVRRPLTAANLTAAALYRAVEHFAPTLIVDEADTFLRDNLQLRGVIKLRPHARHRLRRAHGRPRTRLFSTWGGSRIARGPTLAGASRSPHVNSPPCWRHSASSPSTSGRATTRAKGTPRRTSTPSGAI